MCQFGLDKSGIQVYINDFIFYKVHLNVNNPKNKKNNCNIKFAFMYLIKYSVSIL